MQRSHIQQNTGITFWNYFQALKNATRSPTFAKTAHASVECISQMSYPKFHHGTIYSKIKHKTWSSVHQFWGTGSRKSVRISFSIYSIGVKTESSLSCGAHTDDECDSVRDTLGADRARGNVCEWDDGSVSRAALCPAVTAAVLLPSVMAAVTVTKKLHKSVRVAGRADNNRGRPAKCGNSGTSPNYNKHAHTQTPTLSIWGPSMTSVHLTLACLQLGLITYKDILFDCWSRNVYRSRH